MNANELADELQVCFTKADWEYVDECVSMLRQFGLAESIVKQQALEIEALKKEKWLTEIDYKQQVLKQLIDWLILEQDTLAWRKEKDERK